MLSIEFYFSYPNREGRGNAHLTGDYKRISDVVVRNFDAVTTEYYLKYVEAHPVILDRLEQTILKDSRFAQVVRDFESQKVCYLPLTTLIVKPLHRILHYDLLLERKWHKKLERMNQKVELYSVTFISKRNIWKCVLLYFNAILPW